MPAPLHPLFAWLERLSSGDLSAAPTLALDDPSWRRLYELLQVAHDRWSQERQEVILEQVASIRQATELHHRGLSLLAEKERMQRELLEAERHQSEARLEAEVHRAARLASIGTLAAGVAHEVNNPLTFVVANLEYLSEQLERSAIDGAPLGNAAELQRAVSEMREGVDRIRRIAASLNEFSRIDRDNTRAPVELRSVVDAALGLTKNEIQHRAQVTRRDRGAPPVLAIESRVAQVLVNLLINAAHAIPEGRAADNESRLCIGSDAEGWAFVDVEDTGRGIPSEDLERVFEPFFTTKAKLCGTGLGLSICRSLVDEMWGADHRPKRSGGRITVSSRLSAPPA